MTTEVRIKSFADARRGGRGLHAPARRVIFSLARTTRPPRRGVIRRGDAGRELKPVRPRPRRAASGARAGEPVTVLTLNDGEGG